MDETTTRELTDADIRTVMPEPGAIPKAETDPDEMDGDGTDSGDMDGTDSTS